MTYLRLALTSLSFFLAAACSSNSPADGVPDAHPDPESVLCRGIDCSGHGKCHVWGVGMTDEGHGAVEKPECSCDEGYVSERDGELACIAGTPQTEGYGYRFDREPNADVVSRELDALRGDWFRKVLFWDRDKETGEERTDGFHFDLPNSAGSVVWRTSDQIGNAHFAPPVTQVIQIGVELTGELAGFRPMQFAKSDSPDDGIETILYKRSEERISDLGDEMRPTLLVLDCGGSLTMGIAKPRIDKCASSYAFASFATTYVREKSVSRL